MNKVESVLVISDLHLGASNSLLTSINYDFEKNEYSSNTFAKLFIEKLVNKLTNYPAQKLVLLGDIFEMSFAAYGLAMQNAKYFFEELLKKCPFEEIIYVPGNHDHHLWQQIAEQHYLINNLKEAPPDYPKTLPRREFLNNTFLNEILPEGHKFLVTYPNLEVQVNNHTFYMHHGHYLQKLYILASDFLAETVQNQDIDDLEAFNAPFLELGWYNLGQAYNLGKHKLIDKLYLMYKSGDSKTLDKILNLFLSRIDSWTKKTKPSIFSLFTDWMVKSLGPYFLKNIFLKHSQTFSHHKNASSARHKRLENYLAVSAISYIQKYFLETKPHPGEINFIFGHTHEPEFGFQCSDNLEQKYKLYNPGGWVLDDLNPEGEWILPKMAPLFIDEKGEVTQINLTEEFAGFLQGGIEQEKEYQLLKQNYNKN